MATHSSILAWAVPWTEEPGGLQSEVTESPTRLSTHTHSHPTLCDPMDYNPPGSSVHGTFQARLLEWVAISFFRESSLPRDQTWVLCIAGRFSPI